MTVYVPANPFLDATMVFLGVVLIVRIVRWVISIVMG